MISETVLASADRARARQGFLADVLRGLSRANKTLPCKYFYDRVGGQLFDRICALPEYYVTRAEIAILRRHGPEISQYVGSACTLIEYGSGSGRKVRLLLKHLRLPLAYVPVDVAREQLHDAARALSEDYPHVRIHPLCADFTGPLNLPGNGALFGRRVVYFPGSTIGNFTQGQAVRLLRRTAELCRPGGGLLLTVDLKKDPRVISAAYNDRQGVTAAFNLNLLTRINRELEANFAVEQFWHHALYSPRHGRVEMHLVSRIRQRVVVAQHEFEFDEGESICTEYSHKYNLQDVRELAATAGLQIRQAWSDNQNHVSLSYLTAGK